MSPCYFATDKEGQTIQREKYGTYEFVNKQSKEILLLFCFISEKSEDQIDGLSADVGKGVKRERLCISVQT